MKSDEQHRLDRTSSSCRSSRKIIPSSLSISTTSSSADDDSSPAAAGHRKTLLITKSKNLSAFLRSLIANVSCRWRLALSTTSSPVAALGRSVTGTLFGPKKGHVTFAVQEDPRSDPVLLLELATSTCTLVKEMASGLVRIALECKSGSTGSGNMNRPVRLFQEPMWTMYCNGKKCGYAMSRTCGECEWHVLSTVQTVSVGAGVIPVEKKRVGSGSDDMMYMRARFERVVGNRDSEAFYMMNPDGSGGPELSIFLLRV